MGKVRTLKDIIGDLQKMPKIINDNASVVFDIEVKNILEALKNHSPVDTGTFRDSWKMNIVPSFSSLALRQVKVTNSDYGPKIATLNEGAQPRMAPWYYPGSKQTGKLTVSGGKVWAGGWDPGHDMTTGGPINRVFSRTQSDLRSKILHRVTIGI